MSEVYDAYREDLNRVGRQHVVAMPALALSVIIVSLIFPEWWMVFIFGGVLMANVIAMVARMAWLCHVYSKDTLGRMFSFSDF